MAFDAGMMRCALYEIERESLGARVEKVYQPEKDEIVINIRSRSGGKRIVVNSGSCGRISFTDIARENPPSPPTFCLSLRKHITGALLTKIEQIDFERVALFEFNARDEMGFECVKRLYCEVMGRYSNIILTDGENRVLNALKCVDITTSSKRQVLPGFLYELPPTQNKKDPLKASYEDAVRIFREADPDTPAQKYITDTFCGISRSNAGEIVYRASKHTDTVMGRCSISLLAKTFFEFFSDVREGRYSPSAVYDGSRVVDYSFARLTSYEGKETVCFDSPCAMLDKCFADRDNDAMVRSRASDILKLLCNAEARIEKKLNKQYAELEESKRMDEYKLKGDLITSNIYAIKRGDEEVTLTDYSSYTEEGGFATVTLKLDKSMSPSQNAGYYYKKYNKAKKASEVLIVQIENAKRELEYIKTVFDCLSRATTPTELADIREELYTSGYSSKMKHGGVQKKKKADFLKFRTSGGYTVLCGRNNIQNDLLTHKEAENYDYWFHVKNAPGSHCIMVCSGEEPSEKDFTEAAMIAAVHSSLSDSPMAEVDYTYAKHVKKPSGAKPGFVIYHTNYSAYVKPDREYVEKLKVK